ncbi:hypothetical protein XF30_32480 [Bradyrhizobium sp. SUTN9-2]|nr:hypothetical protein XF30_32480 [Bradyrhizobium sp. SUTN9-2]
METSTRNFHVYLQRSLRRDNDRHDEHSATVNALQNQSVKFLRPHAAAATSKQFDAVVSRFHDFDATRRPYKEPMPLEPARGYLVENAGRQFDPGCVEAFLLRWDEVVEIAGGQRTSPLPVAAAPPAPDIERAAASSSDARRPASRPPDPIDPPTSCRGTIFLRSPV